MTKKDYIKIAEMLKGKRKLIISSKYLNYQAKCLLFNDIVLCLAEVMKEDNDRFDRIKFIDTCYK